MQVVRFSFVHYTSPETSHAALEPVAKWWVGHKKPLFTSDDADD